MKRDKNNRILSEEELDALIQQSIDESKLGDIAKKAGKTALKTAGIGAATLGMLYGVNKGLDNEQKYRDDANRAGANLERYYDNPNDFNDDFYDNECLTQREKYNESTKRKNVTLTESQLYNVIKESVKKILRENKIRK